MIKWLDTTGALTGATVTGAGAGDTMVFVKVRETYDLHTITNKMTLIGIHTPHADIVKKSYPGLLMQCKAYRPFSCDVKIACASMLPADPLQVGTEAGEIAPEDLFNPILYKAMSNKSMSQIEARINMYNGSLTPSTDGQSADVDNTGVSNDFATDFDIYYGLLSDTHGWKHANPQTGLAMSNLKPLVYDVMSTLGDTDRETITPSSGNLLAEVFKGNALDKSDTAVSIVGQVFKGNAHPMPMLNTTVISSEAYENGFGPKTGYPGNIQTIVPAPTVYVAGICIPPSRLHSLYYRMVVEWTLEFSMIRHFSEIVDFAGLDGFGVATHFKDYDYSSAKEIVAVDKDNLTSDTGMVSANVDVTKVM